MADLPDGATLGQAKVWLRERLDEGAECPCCTQFAKVYRRKFNSSMGFGLIKMFRVHGLAWGHGPSTSTLARLGGELARLSMWGLLEEATEKREDGGRAGWWRVTPAGEAFVRGETRVAPYAYIYDGRLLRLDLSERKVSIIDVLGRKFNYAELMGERYPPYFEPVLDSD